MNVDVRRAREPVLWERLHRLSSDYRIAAMRELMLRAIQAESAGYVAIQSVGAMTCSDVNGDEQFISRITLRESDQDDVLLFNYFLNVPLGRRRKRARLLLIKAIAAMDSLALPVQPPAVPAVGHTSISPSTLPNMPPPAAIAAAANQAQHAGKAEAMPRPKAASSLLRMGSIKVKG